MFRKLRNLSWAAVVTALAMVVPSVAQDAYNFTLHRLTQAEPAGRAIGADDTDVAILVRHVGTGTENSGLVAVAAGGDLTFTAGAVGAEAAVDDFECPVSGALAGVIDVSDAACDTIGEVVDTINGACSTCLKGNWFAVAIDALATDSSNDSLLTISATSARPINGLELKWDTDTVGFNSTIAVVPLEARRMPFYLRGVPDAPKLHPKPFVNSRGVLLSANATSTYGSGSSAYKVFSVAQTVSAGQDTTETITQLYQEPAGATTVNKLFGGANGFAPYGLYSRKDEKLVARLSNTAAMASAIHSAYGLFMRYQ